MSTNHVPITSRSPDHVFTVYLYGPPEMVVHEFTRSDLEAAGVTHWIEGDWSVRDPVAMDAIQRLELLPPEDMET